MEEYFYFLVKYFFVNFFLNLTPSAMGITKIRPTSALPHASPYSIMPMALATTPPPPPPPFTLINTLLGCSLSTQQ